jgi:ribose transport system ATP-binding protein
VVLISSEIEEVIEGSDRVVALKDGMVVGLLSGDDVTEENVMEMLAESGLSESGETTDGSLENGGRE